MPRSAIVVRILCATGLFGVAAPALAHGEQVLAFPLSPVLVLSVVVLLAIGWPGRRSVKVTCCAAVLAVAIASWFSPWVPPDCWRDRVIWPRSFGLSCSLRRASSVV